MDTIWLKEVGGGRSAFFPNLRNERFNFTSDVGIFITSLAVEGSSRPRDPNLQPSQPGGGSSGGGSSSRVLSISSNTPPMFKKSTGSSSCVTVKVVYSTMKKIGNKFSFKKLHQAFVSLRPMCIISRKLSGRSGIIIWSWSLMMGCLLRMGLALKVS